LHARLSFEKLAELMAKQLERPELRPSHEEIAQRAYALFEKSGRVSGHEMDNWLEAEAQLTAAKRKPDQRSNSIGTERAASRTAMSQRA
jgi:hypothetical protein